MLFKRSFIEVFQDFGIGYSSHFDSFNESMLGVMLGHEASRCISKDNQRDCYDGIKCYLRKLTAMSMTVLNAI